MSSTSTTNDRVLFLELLDKSELFEASNIRTLLRCAIQEETLPPVDFYYLLDVLKTEQNMYYLIDKKADDMIRTLEKKYER